MAKLNVAKTIERAKQNTPIGYTMGYSTVCELYDRNRGDSFNMMVDGFYLGVAQGMKIMKAKMKRGVAR